MADAIRQARNHRRRGGPGAGVIVALLALPLLAAPSLPVSAHAPEADSAGAAPRIRKAPKTAPKATAALPITFGGDFSLVDHDGKSRTAREFHGRFVLVYFGYTHCPDICPLGLETIAGALDILGAAGGRVQPLFISVDPARDSGPVLKGYVRQFHPRLVGLSGSEAQVREAAKAYRVFRAKVIPDGSKDSGDYLVAHTPTTFLMGPDGAFVTLFPHDTEPEIMAKAIRRYLR